MQNSKIKTISSKFSENKKKWYSEIELEDWTKWTIWHDKEDDYKVGQEIAYKTSLKNWTTDQYWISEIKENKKGWFAQRNYNADFSMKALECAVEFAPQWQTLKGTLECADSMFDWLKKKSLSANQTNNG